MFSWLFIICSVDVKKKKEKEKEKEKKEKKRKVYWKGNDDLYFVYECFFLW